MNPFMLIERYKVSVLALFVTCIVGAFFMLIKMPIEFLPPIESPELSVSIQTGNLSPTEQKETVVKTLFHAFSTVTGIEEIRSIQRDSACQFYLKYRWDTSLSKAETELRDRMDSVMNELPDTCSLPVLRRLAHSRVPLLKIHAEIRSENSDALRRIVLPKLNFTEGTGEIVTVGNPNRVINLYPDFDKLLQLHLEWPEVEAALMQHFENLPITSVQNGGIEIPLLMKNGTDTLRSLEAIPVGKEGIPLKHVAKLKIENDDEAGFFKYNGSDGTLLQIYGSGVSPVATVKRLLSTVRTLNADYPDLFQLNILEDNSRVLIDSIRDLILSFSVGLLSALLIIKAFTRSWRAALITASMIPIAFSVSIFILGCFNKSLNLISLSGLAISSGMIIDNNIIVYDFIRNRGGHPNGSDFKKAFFSVIGSTLSTLIIFIPLFFIKGISGLLFKDLAVIVSLTLLASVATSLVLLPLLFSLVPPLPATPALQAPLQERYRQTLIRLFRRPRRNVILFTLPLLLPILLFPFLQSQFITPRNQHRRTFEFTFNPNDSMETVKNRANTIIADLSAPFHSQSYTIGGESLILSNFEPTLTRQSVQITLFPLSDAQTKRLLTLIRNKPYFPALQSIYRPPQIIESSIGSYAYRNEQIVPLPEDDFPKTEAQKIILEPNYPFLQAAGLTPAEIFSPLAASFGTTLLASVPLQNQSFPLKIKSNRLTSEADLTRLQLTLHQRNYALGQLCRIRKEAIDANRFEINSHPYRIQKEATPQSRPLHGNEFKGQKTTLFLTSFFALLFLLAFLLCLFNQIQKPLIIMLSLPLSLPLATASLLLFHAKLDLDAIIALLILAGSGVNNSILLFQNDRPLLSASDVIDLACDRLRPILMTTTTTLVALLPFLFSHSMAPVLCFGLFASTYLALFLLPLIHPDSPYAPVRFPFAKRPFVKEAHASA